VTSFLSCNSFVLLGLIKDNQLKYNPKYLNKSSTIYQVCTANLTQNSLNTSSLFGLISSMTSFHSGYYHAGLLILEWIDLADSTYFKISSRIQNKSYISFALSYDSKMGNDQVIACSAIKNSSGNLNTFKIEHYYNPSESKSQPRLLIASNPSVGLSDMNFYYSNGYIECSFRRAKFVKNITNYFELKEFYYVLTASGSVQTNGKYKYG